MNICFQLYVHLYISALVCTVKPHFLLCLTEKLDQTSVKAVDLEDGYKHSPSIYTYVHNL